VTGTLNLSGSSKIHDRGQQWAAAQGRAEPLLGDPGRRPKTLQFCAAERPDRTSPGARKRL